MKRIISSIFALMLSAASNAEVIYTGSSESFVEAAERYVVDLTGAQSSDLIEAKPIDYGYSEWQEYGEPFDCELMPSASTVLKGVKFTQTEACLQLQMRHKYTYEYAVLTKTEEEFRHGDAERTIDAVGILTYSFVDEYTAWANAGSVYSCGGYSPATSTVNMGVSFTQSRSCSQAQQRTKSTYKVNDITSERALIDTAQESKVISVSQNQVATGTKATGGKWRFHGMSYGAIYIVMSDLNKMGGTLKNVIEGVSCTNLGEVAGMLVLTGMTEYRLTVLRCQ